MKKICAVILIAMIAFYTVPVHAVEPPAGMDNSAESYVLMDNATGQLILEKDAESRKPSANLSTNMAVLIFLEDMANGKLKEDDKVTVSQNAWRATGSKVFLDINEIYPASELLKAVVVASANDAAIALAEKLYMNEEAFVARMNQKCSELNLMDTKFESIYGKDSANQYTTAKDMATIMREICKYPQYFKWSSIWLDTFTHPSGRTTEMTNFNKVVRFYDGGDGGKTGSSANAGFCLAATAKRGSDRYIYVGLGDISSDNRFENARSAFDYAFNNYTSKTPVQGGKVVARDIPILNGIMDSINGIAKEDISLLLGKEVSDNMDKEVTLIENLTAPIEKGQKLGEIVVKNNGEVIGRCDIISETSVDINSFSHSVNRIVNVWLKFGEE